MSAVVLDVRANGNTGVARYGRRLLTESRARLEGLGRQVYAVVRGRDLPRLEPRFAAGSVRVVAPPSDQDGRYLHRSRWLDELLADVRPALYYTTNYTMAEQCPAPFVFTIHDLVRLTSPGAGSDQEFIERYGADEYRRLCQHTPVLLSGGVFVAYLERLTRALAGKATRIATVSAATAADISSVLQVPAHRISIVPSAVEDGFRPRPAADVQRVRDRLSIRGDYFMYVGLAGVHKRVGWLAEQFLAAAPDCPAGTQLVIVGGQGAEYESVRRLVAEASRDGRVVFTGWLSDEDLAALYTGATACLSGSVKEGFDLPPAEALACGSEAIVTDIPAHREVLGKHAHYFDRGGTVRLRQLLVTAAHGGLPSRGYGFEPPDWRTASRELMRTLGEALRAA